MRKFINFILLSTTLVACKKETFTAPPEFDQIIGTWENITGDCKMRVEIKSNGVFEQSSEYERNIKHISTTCEYNTTYFLLRDKKGNSTVYISLAFGFDTLTFFSGAFNQADSSLNQAVLYVKTK